jgi:hypothetical protein
MVMILVELGTGMGGGLSGVDNNAPQCAVQSIDAFITPPFTSRSCISDTHITAACASSYLLCMCSWCVRLGTSRISALLLACTVQYRYIQYCYECVWHWEGAFCHQDSHRQNAFSWCSGARTGKTATSHINCAQPCMQGSVSTLRACFASSVLSFLHQRCICGLHQDSIDLHHEENSIGELGLQLLHLPFLWVSSPALWLSSPALHAGCCVPGPRHISSIMLLTRHDVWLGI